MFPNVQRTKCLTLELPERRYVERIPDQVPRQKRRPDSRSSHPQTCCRTQTEELIPNSSEKKHKASFMDMSSIDRGQ